MTRGRANIPGAVALVAALGLHGCGDAPPIGGPLDARLVFGEVGGSPGQFSYPRCIDLQRGPDGDSLWVIDKLARVQRLDAATGECKGGWRMPEWENGKPTGITVWTPPAGGKTRIFIADTHYHRIMIYDPDALATGTELMEHHGKLLGRFGSYGEKDGEFIYPTDVAVLPTTDGLGIERVYVSEYGGHDRISVFEPAPGQAKGDEVEFVFRTSFGRYGSGGGEPLEFNRPQSLEIDVVKRELVLTDACNHRMGRVTLDGTLITWIGGVGKEPGKMEYPYGFVLLDDGTAVVSEFGGNRVQRFDLETGASLGVYGEAGRGAGNLASPWGVTSDGGLVYVLDSGNNRVQAFERPRGRVPVSTAKDGGHG